VKRPRHVPTKAELVARLPRGLRPRLAADQKLDLAIVHHMNHELLRTGQADEQVLWQWVGGVLTFSRMADLLDCGVPEMERQTELAVSLLQRYSRTGRVGFAGPELQLALDGVQVMDELAKMVDRPTAVAAADWSEATVNHLAQLAADKAADVLREARLATAV